MDITVNTKQFLDEYCTYHSRQFIKHTLTSTLYKDIIARDYKDIFNTEISGYLLENIVKLSMFWKALNSGFVETIQISEIEFIMIAQLELNIKTGSF